MVEDVVENTRTEPFTHLGNARHPSIGTDKGGTGQSGGKLGVPNLGGVVGSLVGHIDRGL